MKAFNKKSITFLFVVLSLFISCNSNNTNSKADSDTVTSSISDTITNKTLTDTIPSEYGNDTLFSSATFTGEDSANHLLKSFHNKAVSAQACVMSWNAKDFLSALKEADYIGFEYPSRPKIPLKLFGEIIKGTQPDNPPSDKFNLTCEHPSRPQIITSSGAHSVWLRRLFLRKQEIINYLSSISTGDFADLEKPGLSKNFKIIITPRLGIQGTDQYVGADISVMNINSGQQTMGKSLNPCPVCK